MNTFLFIFLAGYAVRCDDSNYYVVQMPDNTHIPPPKDFRVYWNVPTKQCKSRKIEFGDLYEKFGILQNEGDSFLGDKISILYDPGAFPALLRNSSSGQIKYRNGGVPQEGDLIEHLEAFRKHLQERVPDKDFKGVGIIDFESWRPVFRQNFGTLTPYKDVSYEIEKKRHWWWKKQWIEEEAKRRFEEAGREFMQATISLAKKMRPHAVWGYYAFPYCYNMAADKKETCADNVPEENDRVKWLWHESTALYPSVYSSDDISTKQLVGLIQGRVNEAARVGSQGAPILPYFWFRYRDKGYFNEGDLKAAVNTLYESKASGFIIWGSSNDVKTYDKCKNLRKYVTEILGPTVAKYTKPNMRVQDEVDEIYNVFLTPTNASTFDPEYNWIPPVNYTRFVEEMVDEELNEKEKEVAAVLHKDIEESSLVDMILHNIANYCAEGCDNKSEVKRIEDNKTDKDNGTTESHIVLVTEDPFKKISSTIGVTVSTTTEDDEYDYDTDEDIDTSTTNKDIEKISTTLNNNPEISATTENSEEISANNIIKKKMCLLDQITGVNCTNTSNIRNAEFEKNNLIIEGSDIVDTSTEDTSSTEISSTEPSSENSLESGTESNSESSTETTTESSTVNSNGSKTESSTESTTITINATEPGINETNTTESATNFITKDSSSINSSTVVNSTRVEVSTEYKSVYIELSAVDNSATVELRTVDNSATIKPGATDNSTTVELETIDNNAAVELSAVDNRAAVELNTVDNSTTVQMNTVDNSSRIELSTENNSVYVELSAVDNSATVELSTVNNSATIKPGIVDNSTIVELRTVENNAAVELSAVDNRATFELNTVDNSATVETNTVDNSTRVEQSTEYNSVYDGLSAVDNSATVGLSTVDNSATIKPGAVDNSTTSKPSVVDDSTTTKPSVVDDSTTIATNSDNSTTLAPVLTEQVLGSVSRAIVSKPIACSLFFIYSITKCLCLLLGTC